MRSLALSAFATCLVVGVPVGAIESRKPLRIWQASDSMGEN